jgi:hypothetical protein
MRRPWREAAEEKGKMWDELTTAADSVLSARLSNAKKIDRRPDADPAKGLEKYGKATSADSVNNKYPIGRCTCRHSRAGGCRPKGP